MKRIAFLSALLFLFTGVMMSQSSISPDAVNAGIKALTEKYPAADADLIGRGVRHAASLWRTEDGDPAAFQTFCLTAYLADPAERLVVFKKINDYFEALFGHSGAVELALKKNVDEPTGPMHEIDTLFSAFSPTAHLMQDFYQNKIAFHIALNFPLYALDEKNTLGQGWNDEQWAMARLGDLFSARIPAELNQHEAQVSNDAGMYISGYNIHMGTLRDDMGRKLFKDDQVLLTHWNLRDEIKANYADKTLGLARQKMVYQIMKRIIDQSIPRKVIDSAEYEWNPEQNTVIKDGVALPMEREPDTRYDMLRSIFLAQKQMDAHNPVLDTYIKRNFSGNMEVPQEQVEKLFHEFLTSPLLPRVARLVQKRLGRRLEAYDIWYDGFKSRSSIPEETLTAMTRTRYPDAQAFEKDMEAMLKKLGFSAESAAFLASKIEVDPARGSGHAWGTQMRDDKSHLRTRIAQSGMDYKGFNIAVHEFGHNVEQTLSMHRVPFYFLNGVPNTAFTEALAFLFQKRDLEILEMQADESQAKDMAVLDNCWSAFEIMAVSMVDMKVWQWMYDHPETTAAELKEAVIAIAKEVWNRYFAKAFGRSDEPILAIYSHMISYPLYLSAYSFGQLIEFQLGGYLEDKAFGPEVERIWSQGRLTPSAWMIRATGSDLSADPLIKASEAALKRIK